MNDCLEAFGDGAFVLIDGRRPFDGGDGGVADVAERGMCLVELASVHPILQVRM